MFALPAATPKFVIDLTQPVVIDLTKDEVIVISDEEPAPSPVSAPARDAPPVVENTAAASLAIADNALALLSLVAAARTEELTQDYPPAAANPPARLPLKKRSWVVEQAHPANPQVSRAKRSKAKLRPVQYFATPSKRETTRLAERKISVQLKISSEFCDKRDAEDSDYRSDSPSDESSSSSTPEHSK